MSLSDFILGMAKSSQNTGRKNTISDLAKALSQSNYKTKRGGNYNANASRGTGKVLSSIYKEVNKINPISASEIADNFVGKDGRQAWLKK